MLHRLALCARGAFAGKFKKKIVLEEREGNEPTLAKENKSRLGTPVERGRIYLNQEGKVVVESVPM
jgi:hypothetical protein